ncbi:MAG: hypothetical protein DYG88_12270 [Chloroflexi bacterium CFX4]|nr:hypothetical protein [Chloroflexi bacterium CFX4]MDL1923147.1 hypothetical protein [Chloroflexi bacterium CFX3]
MPQIVKWLVDDIVIFSQAIGDLDAADIQATDAKIQSILERGTPPVHVLTDARQVGKFPLDLVGLRRMVNSLRNPRLGYTVIYGAPQLAANFGQMLMRLAGVRGQFVRDYDAAISFLAAQDERIKQRLAAGQIPTES